jgi:hypothetical protein
MLMREEDVAVKLLRVALPAPAVFLLCYSGRISPGGLCQNHE